MTEQYPDWVYDEMSKRMSDAGKGDFTAGDCRGLASEEWPSNAALAKLIFETQEAPEDPYLPIARKAAAEMFLRLAYSTEFAQCVAAGEHDTHVNVQTALTAIHALLEHQEQQA